MLFFTHPVPSVPQSRSTVLNSPSKPLPPPPPKKKVVVEIPIVRIKMASCYTECVKKA